MTNSESQRDSDSKPRVAESARLPWEIASNRASTPTGLRPVPGCGFHNPVGVDDRVDRFPRVARSSQPWALLQNPFGIRQHRSRFAGIEGVGHGKGPSRMNAPRLPKGRVGNPARREGYPPYPGALFAKMRLLAGCGQALGRLRGGAFSRMRGLFPHARPRQPIPISRCQILMRLGMILQRWWLLMFRMGVRLLQNFFDMPRLRKEMLRLGV